MQDYIASVLAAQVLRSGNIPAHDATFAAADKLAEWLARFHAHIAATRSKEQADGALTELVHAAGSAVYDVTRPSWSAK